MNRRLWLISGHLTVPGRGFGSVDDSTAFRGFHEKWVEAGGSMASGYEAVVE